MNHKIYAFLLTIIAGASTLIGYLFIYIKGNKVNIISKTLGFAIGVMLTISVIDLIPNSLDLLLSNYSFFKSLIIIILYFILGLIISNIFSNKIDKKTSNNSKLYKIGVITMLTIIIHNIPEGIATYITSVNNIKLGIIFTIAIALHNIPEGISISIPIYYATNSKIKTFFYTFISGISEFLGAILSYLFLSNYINNISLGMIYSFIAGLMINISINKLSKEAFNCNKKNTIKYFIVGGIVMILSHIIISR